MQNKRHLRNQRGQMAIFVAFTFQVFFVLFAMILNIGLIVFQKINLQNAVDLAAFYAAQRQAEVLNAIAHENYQIRQAYKLLAYRYRVMGMMGFENHPAKSILPESKSEQEWTEWRAKVSGATPTTPLLPMACITHDDWTVVGEGNSYCRELDTIPIPKPFAVVFDLFGLNKIAQDKVKERAENIVKVCDEAGVLNWRWATMIWYAFRQQASRHRQTIAWLGRSFEKPGDFADLNGESVRQGAEQTLLKNLSLPNLQGVDGALEMHNSLAGVPWFQWLVDVPIIMDLQYVDMQTNGGCKRNPRSVRDFDISRDNDETGNLLYKWARTEPPDNGEPNPMRTSMGFEKNPWFMMYVGVKATVKTRSIFHPFGRTTTMTARAFAQPFGGRVGPWYGKIWARGVNSSNALAPVDALAPYRNRQGEAPPAVDLTNVAAVERYYVNYSRYPGDTMGLKSRLPLSMLPPPLERRRKFSLADYVGAIAGDGGNDALAWNSLVKGAPPPIARTYETLAVAPDLFDITYYSIDANFKANYYDKLKVKQQLEGQIFPISRDFGAREGEGPVLENFVVRDQVATVKKTLVTPGQYFYLVSNAAHLLTGWVNEGLYKYDEFPQNFFGNCVAKPEEKVPNPGDCVVGGRTGYSVRLINRSYLNSVNHVLGGPGTKGAIMNPPGDF